MGLKLTEHSIKTLAPPASGSRIHYDAGHPDHIAGFGLRLTAAGARAFVFNYRVRGRERRITIGQLGAWTVRAARERASELRRLVDQGRDPLAERTEERDAPLMAELFTRYLAEHAAIHKKPRSIGEDRSLIHGGKGETPRKPFNGPVGRYFRTMRIADVTRADVMRFHSALRPTPYRANRALALLSKAFNLAEVWEYRAGTNPCRHVQKFREEKRARFLNADELGRLGKALDAGTESPAEVAAIKLLLLTGCRCSELLGLRWTDINMKAGIARLPDAKAGSRDVSLSTPAQSILATLPAGDLVFGSLQYQTLHEAWRRICQAAQLRDARLHTLRHTAGSAAGAGNFSANAIKDLLGHKTLAMVGRYVHASSVTEAAEAIGATLTAAMEGKTAEVVAIGKARKS